MDTEIIQKLESLLRQAQLLPPNSGGHDDSRDEYKEVYAEICEVALKQETIQTLWHEPVLLQLNWPFNRTPPNPQQFGPLTNQLKDRAHETTQIDDLFFSIFNPSSTAEDVYRNLSTICTPDQTLRSRFVASGHVEEIRKSEEPPAAKVSSLLEGLKDDLGLNLLELESIRQNIDCLKQQEVPGRAYALFVRSERGSALTVPLELYFETGEDQSRVWLS